MERPPELVPIPESLQKASESSGKLLHLGKIPKKFGQNLVNIQQNSDKICEILEKREKNSAIFNEKFEIRERAKEYIV